MRESFLTPRGKKYARIIFLVHRYCTTIRNRFFRNLASKYIVAALVSMIYFTILKEGAQEHARTRKTKMPGMPNGVSAGGKRTPGEVREMRISSERLSSISAVVETSAEGCSTSANSKEKI